MKSSKAIFFKVYLLTATIYCMSSFELTCPDTSQWNFLSQSRCSNNHDNPHYYCLYDANNLKFIEKCRKKTDFQRPGYKLVFRGSLDAIECATEYYQPFKFWTNVSSECLLRKSECTEEGQITIDNGNSTFDRICRCDYTRGYTFIKTPVHKCFCMSSEEDCSCHKRLCPIDHILTPDYGCVKQEEWTGHYVCPTIKIPMLKEAECSTRPTPVPTFDTPGKVFLLPFKKHLFIMKV
ncbi:unnamed protein product [Mytilus coruscus]|uniref:Uncharacterized protein n=1 Tax=Mytilus coruscus TaxID=42192 RepID=A0A6J8CSQ4_MYTCO|nr:unnamed protein product [Mytilus coruscus]